MWGVFTALSYASVENVARLARRRSSAPHVRDVGSFESTCGRILHALALLCERTDGRDRDLKEALHEMSGPGEIVRVR
jgi:hypothetical protein